jgi:hypothetical protein
MKWDETAWLASRCPSVQSTPSTVRLCLSLSVVDCFCALWSEMLLQSYSLLSEIFCILLKVTCNAVGCFTSSFLVNHEREDCTVPWGISLLHDAVRATWLANESCLVLRNLFRWCVAFHCTWYITCFLLAQILTVMVVCGRRCFILTQLSHVHTLVCSEKACRFGFRDWYGDRSFSVRLN